MARWVIADDSRPLRLFFKSALLMAGQEVVGEADEGAAALKLCRKLRPDFVHLDISMPGMQGSDAALAILAEGLVAGQVIIVSSNTQAAVMDQLRAAGCAHITKPLRSHHEYAAAIAPLVAKFEGR